MTGILSYEAVKGDTLVVAVIAHETEHGVVVLERRAGFFSFGDKAERPGALGQVDRMRFAGAWFSIEKVKSEHGGSINFSLFYCPH
jgi:hypothetical protein